MIVPAKRSGAPKLPAQAVDDLYAKCKELAALSGDSRVIGSARSMVAGVSPRRLLLCPLIRHALATAAKISELAEPRDILDALSILAGVYGPRGDAEIIASVGLAMVQAEQPTKIELWLTLMALLRPIPAEEESSSNDYTHTPPIPRKFAPTLSEFIAELQEQKRAWNWIAKASREDAAATRRRTATVEDTSRGMTISANVRWQLRVCRAAIMGECERNWRSTCLR